MPNADLSSLETAIETGDINIVSVVAVAVLFTFGLSLVGFLVARTQTFSSASQRELMALAGDIVRERMNPFESEMRTEIERCQKSEKKLTAEVDKLHARIESLEASRKNGDR